jgi:hypothetical protein
MENRYENQERFGEKMEMRNREKEKGHEKKIWWQ